MREFVERCTLLALWIASGLFCALVLILALNNIWLIAGPILIGCWGLVLKIRREGR